jgi:hypothetical protein
MLVPYPLSHRIVEPTLSEWTQAEPLCAEPYLWSGGYSNSKRALELNPPGAIRISRQRVRFSEQDQRVSVEGIAAAKRSPGFLFADHTGVAG